MSRERASSAVERIETTIGELIEAVTEIAMESGKSEEEGYRLASLTLERIFRSQRTTTQQIN